MKNTSNHIGYKTIFNNHIASPINTEHNKSSSIRDIFNTLQQSMSIHTSVVNKITFQVLPSWKWELKLNPEFFDFNKNETNNLIITFHFKNTIQHSFFNFTKIYADAFKSQHGIGFSVIKDDTVIQHKLPIITRIFSAKNYNIYEGVKLANTLESNDILLISDFLSTLLALKNLSIKNEITLNIQKKLIETKKYSIHVVTIPHWYRRK